MYTIKLNVDKYNIYLKKETMGLNKKIKILNRKITIKYLDLISGFIDACVDVL